MTPTRHYIRQTFIYAFLAGFLAAGCLSGFIGYAYARYDHALTSEAINALNSKTAAIERMNELFEMADRLAVEVES